MDIPQQSPADTRFPKSLSWNCCSRMYRLPEEGPNGRLTPFSRFRWFESRTRSSMRCTSYEFMTLLCMTQTKFFYVRGSDRFISANKPCADGSSCFSLRFQPHNTSNIPGKQMAVTAKISSKCRTNVESVVANTSLLSPPPKKKGGVTSAKLHDMTATPGRSQALLDTEDDTAFIHAWRLCSTAL